MSEMIGENGVTLENAHAFPVRVSVMTYNVWGNMYWPQRRESLAQTILTVRPDVLLLQGKIIYSLWFVFDGTVLAELTPAIVEALDKTLSFGYKRVDGECKCQTLGGKQLAVGHDDLHDDLQV
jgi:hypothetical protein